MAVQQTEVGAASFYGWIVTRASTNAIRFDGQVAVIVGAGPGLGATLAGRFAANGANIAIVARSEYSLQAARTAAAAASARTETLAIGADMTVPVDAIRMADAVFERFGRVDVLVNLAFGVTPRRNVLDMDTEALELWRRVVEVGGYGTLLASRYLAPEMVRCGRGAIVNVTSMSSRIGFAGRSEYAAGKAQAHKIAHALADELGPHGVRINCVAPGHIRIEQLLTYYRTCARERGLKFETVLTEFTDDAALRKIVTADEVVNAVLFLSSDLASGITGAVLDVNAGAAVCSIGPIRNEGNPHARPGDLPDAGGGRWLAANGGSRSVQWRDMEVGFTTAGPTDCTKICSAVGMPGGVCPHYGSVFEGAITAIYPNTDWPEETARAGEVHFSLPAMY